MFVRCLLLWAAVFLLPARGGFIREHSFALSNHSALVLSPFVVLVALDVDHQLMKFLVNAKVVVGPDAPPAAPVVTDVDAATNRYTTLHVEIDFMGKAFVRENLRFCDVLTVKNTSLYEDTYRFDGLAAAATADTAAALLLLLPAAAATGLANPDWANPDLPGNRPGPINGTARARDPGPAGPAGLAGPAAAGVSMASTNASVEALFAAGTSAGGALGCPLYANDSIAFYFQADVSANYRKFGSYSVRLSVVANDEDSAVIGSGAGYVTSSVRAEGIERLLFRGILTVCVCAWVMHFAITVCSPNQESLNPFLIEASAICNEGLLRQLEAPPLALLSYLQYALFMSGLDIHYPGFFLFLMRRLRWCALLGINVLPQWTSLPTADLDNVYRSYDSGLMALAQYSANGYGTYSWLSFFACLLIWVAAALAAYQVFIFTKLFAHSRQSPAFLRTLFGHPAAGAPTTPDKGAAAPRFQYSVRTNAWALLGNLLREFLTTFGFPFVTLTIYMLATASATGSARGGGGGGDGLSEASALSPTVPYDILFPREIGPHSRTPHTDLGHGRVGVSTVSVAVGSLALAAWLGSLLAFLYRYVLPVLVRGHARQNVPKLYTSVKAIVTWAYLYNAYTPSKAYYVAVDMLGCVLLLVVIAALQAQPATQVVLTVVLQMLAFALLVVVRPHFLALTWYSLPVLMHTCRLLVALLNIPYLSQLDVSEASRSRVAYAQMAVHFLAVNAYIVHLVYCLIITLAAVLKAHRRSLAGETLGPVHATATCASSLSEFEFRQVPPPRALLQNTCELQASSRSSLEDGDVDYYRSNSEQIRRGFESQSFILEMKEGSPAAADDTSLDFRLTEHRIRHTDYTTREVDQLYQKYFSTQEMDPEMKALWQARDYNNSTRSLQARDHNNNTRSLQAKGASGSSANGIFSGLWERLLPRKKKGFEVMRRPPILVHQAIVRPFDDEPTSNGSMKELSEGVPGP